ncbi:MAG: helix-turn-helix domain-containing protein [Blautia sp.]|nr:helix-turn-helix domain-containing protein [Blautia sp.]
MKNEKTDIAKELSRICKEKGISRYSLSKRTGIPDSTLQNYENGTTPNFSTLEIICEAMGTTIADFFRDGCFDYFTEDQEELMHLFEQMTPEQQQRLLAFAAGLGSDL